MKPLVIETSGKMIEVMPNDGKSFTLDELRSIVGGTVQLITLPNGLQLWMNDEGKLDGLPLNNVATLLWQTIYHGYDIGGDDVVVGNCLLCEAKYTADGEDSPTN